MFFCRQRQKSREVGSRALSIFINEVLKTLSDLDQNDSFPPTKNSPHGEFFVVFDITKNHLYNTHPMVDKKAFHEEDTLLEDELDATTLDDIELEDDEARKEDKINILRQKLKTCEAEKMQALEEKERTRADFLNSRRRIEEQASLDSERGIERTLTDFLVLLDSFETALAQQETEGGAHWRKGIEAMQLQFLAILKTYGVTEIETTAKEFNPHEHEAVGHLPADTPKEVDIIKQVLQKGYKRNETILRPAKVLIGA